MNSQNPGLFIYLFKLIFPEMEAQIFLNHIGFLCHSKKAFVAENSAATRFEVQDMGIIEAEALGKYENWKTVFEGKLTKSDTEMGRYLTGDFTVLNKPGV